MHSRIKIVSKELLLLMAMANVIQLQNDFFLIHDPSATNSHPIEFQYKDYRHNIHLLIYLNI